MFPNFNRHEGDTYDSKRYDGGLCYGCKEERVTISGNIRMYDPYRGGIQEISVKEYEEKEQTLKIMEESVKITKEQLKMMKKVGEKEGSI